MSNSAQNIEYSLGDLVRMVTNGVAIFNIKESDDSDIHLSALMLKDYVMGIDFEKSELLFGRKKV